MGKPYSVDLRKRVVAAIEGGMSRNQAARQFGVAISTAIGWMQRVEADWQLLLPDPDGRSQAEGDFRASTRPGYRSGSGPAISPCVRLVAELGRRGLSGRLPLGVGGFVHAEKLSFKKSVVAGERDRPDVRARARPVDKVSRSRRT